MDAWFMVKTQLANSHLPRLCRSTHFLPILKMSETSPYWDRPSSPLGADQPKWGFTAYPAQTGNEL